MPIDSILTKNEKLKIKSHEIGRKLVLECEDETAYYCPYCGSYELRTKDTFIRNIKHITIGGKPSIMRIKRHKYCCKSCGKYFNGSPKGILKNQQSSEGLKTEVFYRHCEGVSKKDLSYDMGVSDSSIERWFQQGYRKKNKEYSNARCPMVLGIDEHHFSKKQGYVTTLVNLSKRKVFDVLPGRSERELVPYLTRLQGKDKVRIVVMDLSANYRSIIRKYFPNAMIVADRFHVVKLALESFIKTAYTLDTDLKKKFGLGRLLRKKRCNLNDKQQALLSKYFETQPTVETIYEVTQKLIELLNEKRCKYKDCKNRLVPMLINFIEVLKDCGFEHFKKLGRTMDSWQSEIGRMFRFTKSNGITEGFHRKMKLIQRRAYGFRSFANYRLRVRVLCA